MLLAAVCEVAAHECLWLTSTNSPLFLCPLSLTCHMLASADKVTPHLQSMSCRACLHMARGIQVLAHKGSVVDAHIRPFARCERCNLTVLQYLAGLRLLDSYCIGHSSISQPCHHLQYLGAPHTLREAADLPGELHLLRILAAQHVTTCTAAC